MDVNFALEGQQAADRRNYFGWLAFGALLGIIGPLFAHLMTPVAPARRARKGAD